MLYVCHTTPTQKLFCFHVFCQAEPPHRVDCLAPRWETALSVFPKDTATRYRITELVLNRRGQHFRRILPNMEYNTRAKNGNS